MDNLSVRGRMTVHELLISQLRASNGNVLISKTGKVESVGTGADYVKPENLTNGLLLHLTFDEDLLTNYGSYTGVITAAGDVQNRTGDYKVGRASA